MKLRFGLALGILFLVVPGIGRTADPVDWHLATVTAGESGASVVLIIEGAGEATGDGPFVFGDGFAQVGEFSFVSVFNVGGDGIHVTTTRPIGSVDIQITPGSGGGFGFGSIGILELRPGDTVAVLSFFGNGVLTDLTSSMAVLDGTATLTESSGVGTTVMRIADPDNGGVAAGISSAAAGTATYQASSESGLVGAFEFVCSVCTGDWSSPDGRTGSWIGLGIDAIVIGQFMGSGETSFAGPAGDWSWGWTGAVLNQTFGFPIVAGGSPIMGAWAPIGDDWSIFR